ncbi:phage antirepressor KilAC domain-containing protein [Bacillus amyloliquefaciens]|uniref:phage antirepressor KilAC domain-containing protein n=1 Tax=Bacillus amyloliquefaciens TaxID=1390 RepID=UPI000B451A81|nr:phage antirepressor KilAC domain-containing protein [Bacillus amyloliquefaciens]ARW39026.1 SPBc2 prophage-derived putative antirepressor protein YoqD [Bacillus amyloliquefaciens]TXK26000.1 Rha family transcriptional regulator [Bacillus amyloliquefaciens]TXK32576.1 Rha family transcriptional regulator [Bacillus amyloliquefaciens]WBY35459.1 phage antirepressor KilAC domain-containing protein [Bacillus amyloliquefaciens]WJM56500.1 phage antirepressor KilAC domain-containing protein [Bacillus a
MKLKVISKKNQLLVDSREVAEMTGKRHGHLIRDIECYLVIINQNPKLEADKFFIESSYKAGTGKKYKNFLLTRKGCDMVANKMTGEKGILFTAAYVTKFEEMENKLNLNIPQSLPEALRLAADLAEKNEHLLLENAQKNQMINELQPKASYYDLVLQNKSLLSISKIAKDYGMSGTKMNKLLHELEIQFKQGNCWLLYQKYADKGYTQSKTHTIDSEKSKLHTYWTQKGRLFIYETLKNKKGILPMIEQEERAS